MPSPRVLAVRVADHSRRTPFVEVEVEIGPVALVVGVVATRTRWLEARMPEGMSGGPAIIAPPEVLAEVQRLALAAAIADPAGRWHLMNHRNERRVYGAGL